MKMKDRIKPNSPALLTSKKLLCLLIAFILSLSLFSCAENGSAGTGSDISDEQTDTESSGTPGFELSSDWVIVRPDSGDQLEIDSLRLINRCMNSVYGKGLTAGNDYVKAGQEIVPAEHEILIGRTNRTQSTETNAVLEGEEGVYKVYSDKVIVITGGSPAATYQAALAFCRDVFGYEERTDSDGNVTVISKGKAASIQTGMSGTAAASFPSVIINGTNLKDYAIVTDRTGIIIDNFVKNILAVCGKSLPVLTVSEYKEGPAIFIGFDPDSEAKHVSEAFDSYSYYVVAKGNHIAIDYNIKSSERAYLTDFVSNYISTSNTGTVNVTIPEGINRLYIHTGEHNGLHIVKKTESSLSDGITYSEVKYKDFDGAPVNVYAVISKAGAGRYYAGLPNDADSENSTVSTALNTAKSVNGNGKTVIAGTNGGFFDMGETNISRGIVVKEGNLIRFEESRPVFAQLKDGTVMLLENSQYSSYSSQINTAVAGNIIIMKKGAVVNPAAGTEMAYTRHPRTAIGIRDDGTSVLFVVDGRQTGVSNGASYLDLVTIARDFGCTSLLNLDGGGSSTMITKGSSAGTFNLKNSPSGGTMRQVQDCLLILAP